MMVKLHVLIDLHLECADFEPTSDAVDATDGNWTVIHEL